MMAPPQHSGHSACDWTRTRRCRTPMLCTAAAELRDPHTRAAGASSVRKSSHTPCPKQPPLALASSLRVRGILLPTLLLARHYIGTASYNLRYQPEKAQPLLTRKQPCALGGRSNALHHLRKCRSLCDKTCTCQRMVALACTQAFARWRWSNILPVRNCPSRFHTPTLQKVGAAANSGHKDAHAVAPQQQPTHMHTKAAPCSHARVIAMAMQQHHPLRYHSMRNGTRT